MKEITQTLQTGCASAIGYRLLGGRVSGDRFSCRLAVYVP